MAIHAQSIRNLAAEDYQLIEEEHLRLHELLDNLRATCCNLGNQLGCQGCSSEKLAACKGQLTSSFHNLVYLSDNHFFHEESIMRNWPRIAEEYEQFHRHRQAHAGIMVALHQTVSECAVLDGQGETAEGYRRLYTRMSELLEEHGHLFDDPFIRSTQS